MIEPHLLNESVCTSACQTKLRKRVGQFLLCVNHQTVIMSYSTQTGCANNSRSKSILAKSIVRSRRNTFTRLFCCERKMQEARCVYFSRFQIKTAAPLAWVKHKFFIRYSEMLTLFYFFSLSNTNSWADCRHIVSRRQLLKWLGIPFSLPSSCPTFRLISTFSLFLLSFYDFIVCIFNLF